MPLDSNLAALLATPVNYYPRNPGADKYGIETQAANPIVLNCYPAFGVNQIEKPDGTVYTSGQALYFDATDETVQAFQLGDRFQAPGIAGGQLVEAQRIEASYSPGPGFGEPMTAWIVEVVL